MLQTFKLEHVFIRMIEILRWRPRWPSVRFLRPNSLKKLDIKHFNFDFLSMLRDLIIQTIKMKHSQV